MSSIKKLEKIYYSPKGYWRGFNAIKRLSTEEAKNWLKKQAILQIYLPAPKHIPRPKFDIRILNEIH